MKTILKNLINRLLGLRKEKLPTGMLEFESWASSIISIYGFPDNDSIRFALATMIMHADSGMGYASKRYFAVRMIKGMANQVAGQVFQDIKTKQQEQIKAELAKQTEVTVETSAPQSESQQ